MSLAAKIDNLPTFSSRTDFTISTINSYLLANSSDQIRRDLMSYGVPMLRAMTSTHDNMTLSALQESLRLVVDGSWEMRKNSWSNSVISAVEREDNRVIASLISSKWRWLLGKCGNFKGYDKKNQASNIGLCEWCNKDIEIPHNSGYTCPHCGVHFDSHFGQKAHVAREVHELYYEENYDDMSIVEKVRRGEISLEKTNFSHGAQPTLL